MTASNPIVMAARLPHPLVHQICSEARDHLTALGRPGTPAPPVRRWLNNRASQIEPLIPELSARDLDMLAGCMERVQRALQQARPSLLPGRVVGRVRTDIGRRLRIPRR